MLRLLYRIFCYSIYDHFTDNYPIEELGYKGLLPYFLVLIYIYIIDCSKKRRRNKRIEEKDRKR